MQVFAIVTTAITTFFSPLNMSNATILLPTRKRQKDEATPNILRVKKPTVDYIFRHFLIIIMR